MRLNDTLSNMWLPLLAGLAIGILLGWLVLSPTFSPIHTTEGGPRNLQGRHLDTLVAGLIPYAEEMRAGDDEESRIDASNQIALALCYPIEDYEAVTARRETLDSDPFTLLQYDTVLDTFDEWTTCEAYRNYESNADVEINEGDTFGAGRWIAPLLFIFAILGIGALLLNSRGVSLNNLNRPSSQQRQRRPRFSLDRNREGNDRNKGRNRNREGDDRNRDRDIDVPRYSRRSENSEMDVPAYESRVTEPEPELIPPVPKPESRPSRSSYDDYEPESQTVIEEPIVDDDGFTATYSRGDEAFERVFEIYGTDNQYLGDCSIEIADSLGNDPADVTAFKIRLFEAGSPRSITKLLMSEHVFNDHALKVRLGAQGDTVLAQMGEPVTLEGKSITVDTYLTDLLYSNDSGQPVRSVFDRVTVKLKAFVNRPDDSDDGSNILEF